jgi:hypothetical protein
VDNCIRPRYPEHHREGESTSTSELWEVLAWVLVTIKIYVGDRYGGFVVRLCPGVSRASWNCLRTCVSDATFRCHFISGSSSRRETACTGRVIDESRNLLEVTRSLHRFRSGSAVSRACKACSRARHHLMPIEYACPPWLSGLPVL